MARIISGKNVINIEPQDWVRFDYVNLTIENQRLYQINGLKLRIY